mgnify:CR=1 FL=1
MTDEEIFHWLLSNRSAVKKMIVGAIKDTINSHGPITKEWTGSAAKRVIAHFLGLVKTLRKDLEVK